MNLGGVGNLTWIDPRKSRPEEVGALLAFDTGPANAPINDLMMDWFGKPYDDGGAVARDGTPVLKIVADYLDHKYFSRMPPKSLDRLDFAPLLEAVDPLSAFDAAATCVEVIAQSVAQSLSFCPEAPEKLWISGGGRKNPIIMEALSQHLNVAVNDIDTTGLNGDMIEAHPPPAPQGRRIKLRYMTQAKTRPPGFVVMCSHNDKVPESYSRYLVNGLREDFDMPGTPIRLTMRGQGNDNPYKGKREKRPGALGKHLKKNRG